MRLAKSISTVLLACTIAGCATAVFNPARNLPLQPGTPVEMAPEKANELVVPDDLGRRVI